MADFTNTKTVFSGKNRLVVKATGLYATSDETNKVVIDISTLTGPDGTAPTNLKINEITYDVNGFDYVLLEFDQGTDDVIGYFSGQGYIDYRPYGGLKDDGTGGTGDLILTTAGGASNSILSFLIDVTLED